MHLSSGPRALHLQNTSGAVTPGIWELKIVDHPWQPTRTITMCVRELLIVLVEMVATEGWSV